MPFLFRKNDFQFKDVKEINSPALRKKEIVQVGNEDTLFFPSARKFTRKIKLLKTKSKRKKIRTWNYNKIGINFLLVNIPARENFRNQLRHLLRFFSVQFVSWPIFHSLKYRQILNISKILKQIILIINIINKKLDFLKTSFIGGVW